MDLRFIGAVEGEHRLHTTSITNLIDRVFAVFIFQITALLLLAGCATTEAPAVVHDEDVMLVLEAGLRPENLLFPEYLFLLDLELDQHGRIPQSTLIGADLRTEVDLKTIQRQYNKVLAAHGWQITKAEFAMQSFRLMAGKEGEFLEIRGVQGTGSTQVFILYTPDTGTPVAQ